MERSIEILEDKLKYNKKLCFRCGYIFTSIKSDLYEFDDEIIIKCPECDYIIRINNGKI